MIEKRLIAPGRLRHPPSGFGWVDHRLVREGIIRECSTDALALYLVLVTVSDRQGLSFYGDALLCTMLGWNRERLKKARETLQHADLLAWDPPIYQLLNIREKGGDRS